MTAFWTRWLVIGLCAVAAEAVDAAGNDAPAGQRLERLKYNHSGLAEDLGVGLWAFPRPMDFNGDGRLDIRLLPISALLPAPLAGTS